MKSESTRQTTDERLPYEAPAIIYEGELTTRAGTTPESGTLGFNGDPSKLFGNLD